MPTIIGPATGGSGGGWAYKKLATIDATKVSGSVDLTYYLFEVVVASDSDIMAAANADGSDLAFFSSDLSMQLPASLVSYDPLTGGFRALVQVPTVDYDDDTEIALAYGNSSLELQRAVAFEHCVMHLSFDGADGATEAIDTTGRHQVTFLGDAVLDDDVTPALGSAALLLDGVDSYVTTPYSQDFTPAGDFTIAAWVRPGASDASTIPILEQWEDANNRWYLAWLGGNYWRLFVRSAGATVFDVVGSGGNPVLNTWQHIAVTRTGDTFKILSDGVDITNTGGTDSDAFPDTNAELRIGAGYLGTTAVWTYGTCVLDELQLIDGKGWTADEALTYINSCTPATFFSLGSQENVSVNVTTGASRSLVNPDDNQLGSATTAFLVDGLNLTNDHLYRFTFDIGDASSGANALSLYFNGDTTATNYYTEDVDATGSTLVAANANDAVIGHIDADERTTIRMSIERDASGIIRAIVESSYGTGANTSWRKAALVFTAANLTSIQISSAGNMLANSSVLGQAIS